MLKSMRTVVPGRNGRLTSQRKAKINVARIESVEYFFNPEDAVGNYLLLTMFSGRRIYAVGKIDEFDESSSE